MSATDTVNSHDNRNCQFEIVTRGREALRARHLVPKSKAAAEHDGDGEDNGKVDDQRRADAEDRRDLRDDVFTLRSEEDDNGKNETDQRPRRDEADEVELVFALPEQ